MTQAAWRYPSALSSGPLQLHLEEQMRIRVGSILLLAVFFALTMSMTAFATEPCGVANQIYCQGQDLTGSLFASQNDTNIGGFGNFATAYDNFTLSNTWDVESFHFVGGYFAGSPAAISGWTLTFYNDASGAPGGAIATGFFAGNGGETLLPNGLYQYDLYFNNFDMGPGPYRASVHRLGLAMEHHGSASGAPAGR